MPMSPATSSIGLSAAPRALARSLAQGTGHSWGPGLRLDTACPPRHPPHLIRPARRVRPCLELSRRVVLSVAPPAGGGAGPGPSVGPHAVLRGVRPAAAHVRAAAPPARCARPGPDRGARFAERWQRPHAL